ncbi:MAG: hypothetical protein BWX61_01412 [Bacteroidetes bacterium ADurb.Bin035]|nr:MAG: hypothetical protein BWX61_01412 [Bacteroidetes bacterium ADurb.Bin035]
MAKSCIKVSPYALVNCNETPSRNEKTKKRAILVFLNNLNASNPRASVKVAFLPFPRGGHLGKVNEYKAKNNDAPEAI